MVAEKAMLKFLQTDPALILLGLEIWWEEAPEAVEEPFMVLHSISSRQTLQAGFSHTAMQLDVFHRDRFKALEVADALIRAIWHRSADAEGLYITGIAAQRTSPLKVEGDVWKVPVDITFNAKEKRP